MLRKLLWSPILSLLAMMVLPGLALAQAYPAKPVRIVISFPPGGSTDFLGRLLAERMQAGMQQSVVVDNRPGGNSVIAAEAVAKAAPDGYTLFMAVDATMSLNPIIYTKLPYSPEKDFAPISNVASQSLFIVAGPRSPVRTMPELLAYARANPGKLSYGTSAQLQMLVGEKLKMDSKVNMLHVPFKGSPGMVQAVLGGEIDFCITAVMPYATYVKDGKLFGLATSGARREQMLPNTPTVRELGLGDLELGNWSALFAPAGTPPAILERLNAEVRRAMGDTTVAERLGAAGIYPSPGSPAELRALIAADQERWGKIIRAANIKLE